MRDATLAHVGGDLYGSFQPGRKVGRFAYTVFGGDNIQGIYGGYPFLLTVHGIYIKHSSGPVWGGDLRWNTPAKGLLVGASYENDQTTNTGTMNPSVALGGPVRHTSLLGEVAEGFHRAVLQRLHPGQPAHRCRIPALFAGFHDL